MRLALPMVLAGAAMAVARPDLARPVAAPTPRPAAGDGRVRYAGGTAGRIALPDGTARTVTSVLEVPGRMSYGQFVWREPRSARGPLWVRVDIERQIASVFRGGDEIGTAVILYGADDRRTPRGVLRILSKSRVHRSSIYDADMPFTLRLTGDGISIHASRVVGGRATHGCIGLPPRFAQLLFERASVGDVVAIS